MSILLVDDDMEILVLYSEILKNAGFQVITCKDGLEAMAILSNISDISEIEAIVSDVVMPNIGGTEFAVECNCEYPNIPFILCSGNPKAAKFGSLLQNVVSILNKPLKSDQLTNAIKDGIKLRAA